jgi:rSAM/selenodomain-associated transferase 1
MPSLSELHIAVFAKPLVPGEVKTRLIPSVGAKGAADIQRSILWNTLTAAREVAGRQVSIWVAGDPDHPTLQAYRDAFALKVRVQQGRGLGTRMHSAMATLLREHARVLLVGCDCPVLSAQNVLESAAKLDDAGTDAVFIPVEDGGYVLVGLAPRPGGQKIALDAVFNGISWSTDRVMAQTRAQLAMAGLDWVEQPMLWDIDRPEDVRRAEALGVLETWRYGG